MPRAIEEIQADMRAARDAGDWERLEVLKAEHQQAILDAFEDAPEGSIYVHVREREPDTD